MSGRRHTPTPGVPVDGPNPELAPPEQYLASTDPQEGPLVSPLAQAPPSGAIEGPREEDHRLVDDPVVEEVEEELSPEEQVMFASLLTCGRRTKAITLFDHTVVVQTLCGDDDLRIGLYAKEYVGSLGEQRAYQIGVAAAGVRTIDGRPFVDSLFEGAEESALFDQKATKMAKLYPTVINKIYRAVLDAEKEFVELATRLGKLDG